MCTALRVKVKASNFFAPRYYNVGCGECEECRAVYKSAWYFRLCSEFEPLVEEHWNLCFCTLTYKDECLPHFPLCVFKNPLDYCKIPCFSRTDCSEFIKGLRDFHFRNGHTDLKYFLATEYGSHTQRPHMHMLLAVPPDLDPRIYFDWIVDNWTGKGFVFPRYYEGGLDKFNYEHLPFVVKEPLKAIRYVAKYATKDLYYKEMLEDKLTKLGKPSIDELFDTSSRIFKRCRQFHLQTKSLGFERFSCMSDADKVKALRDGMFFLGDSEPRKVPVYIKNRLLFDNDYVRPYVLLENKVVADWLNIPVSMVMPEHLAQYAQAHYKQNNYVLAEHTNKLFVPFLGLSGEHKRYVRRKPTEFFKANYEQIYNLKVAFSKASFDRMLDANNWSGRSTFAPFAISELRHLMQVAEPYGGLSRWYVTFYGVPLDRVPRLDTDKFCHYWYSRYDDFFEWQESFEPLADSVKLVFDYLNCQLSAVFKFWSQFPRQRSNDEREKDYLTDLFKSIDY